MKSLLSTRNRKVSVGVRHALFVAAAAAGALPASQVFAQEQPLEEVIVTGSILRRTDAETPSPVTVISAQSLEERGINTVSEALQRLSANNAGTIQQGWNTGFNFASGANAPALRGLTVQATLSVADGLRLAPYPLADDGQRNFVDLNTIPNAIVERIEVLRDGASSTYGADAIAGVINVITKKEIQGFHIGGSKGISEQGGGDENRIDLTWGHGDLESEGYNFYISGEYQKQDPLWARDRDAPFNTTDWTNQCGTAPDGSATCMHNLNWNGVTAEDGNFNGLISIPGVALVRRIDNPTTSSTQTGSPYLRYDYLNPAAGCRGFATADATGLSGTSPTTICEIDLQNKYIMLQPEIKRTGLSMRFTTNIGENAQFYAMANFYKTDTFASFTPLGFNGALPPPNPAGLAAANVDLPVYVCSTGVGTFNNVNTGCNAGNGVLNPYNPYAALGDRAQLFMRSPNGRTVETNSRALRAVAGLEGSFGEGWNYSANFTTSEIGLQVVQNNYLIPQRVWDVAARGSFNFADPEATPQEVWDYIAPENSKHNTSRLWQVQGTIAKELFELPGGAMQAAVGVAYREESIDAPSGNPGNISAPYTRFYSVNAVGTAGSRDVKSGFFEISAPVLKSLEFAGSGRYDEYSSGQSNFSPKIGFKFTPVEMIAIRGTYSKGFRIPSFNEAYGLPTTGYVSRVVDCGANPGFCAAHGGNAYATGAYNLGLTQTGNEALDPEKSTSFTAGLVFEPMRNLSFTLDYWQIEVKDLITGVTSTQPVEDAYYANNGVVNIPGFNAVPGTPDPAFPNALPVLGFIESSFTNQNKQEVAGIDLGANLTLPLGDVVTLKSSLEMSFLKKFELTQDDGQVFNYEGTLSPCNITSCSGAPELRGSWQNTVSFGAATVSLTAYYTAGYDTASIDFGGVEGDCQGNAQIASSTASYAWVDPGPDGLVAPVNCTQKAQWNADLTARYTINDKYQVYLDVLNVFDIEPEFDPSAAYGLFGFNPAWGGPNIMGRYFRVGVKLDL
ncbi:MAG: TonB-dependent receptor [Pseudomonadota bacterium]